MKESRTARGGAAGILLLFAVAIGVAGLGFDYTTNTARGFWIGAEPGARAIIGVGVVCVLLLAAHALRWLLRRRERGGRDARDHL